MVIIEQTTNELQQKPHRKHSRDSKRLSSTATSEFDNAELLKTANLKTTAPATNVEQLEGFSHKEHQKLIAFEKVSFPAGAADETSGSSHSIAGVDGIFLALLIFGEKTFGPFIFGGTLPYPISSCA